MYNFLFKHGQSLTDDNLRLSAAKLGIIVSKFDLELRDRIHSRRVDEDIQSGKERGVTKTPTFFINGDIPVYSIGIRPDDLSICNVPNMMDAVASASSSMFATSLDTKEIIGFRVS